MEECTFKPRTNSTNKKSYLVPNSANRKRSSDFPNEKSVSTFDSFEKQKEECLFKPKFFTRMGASPVAGKLTK